MRFPRLVFKCPGLFQCQGGTYDHKAVEDHAQFDEAITAGWFATIPHALDNLNPVVVAKTDTVDSTTTDTEQSPDQSLETKANELDEEDEPTRDELETKANELGIKFSPNISDGKLAERIAEALKE